MMLSVVNVYCSTWFVSPQGNDENDGLSIQTAWKSLEKVNQLQLSPGDKVLLQGEGLFRGKLVLDENDRGTKQKPILIAAFGVGNAVIHAADSTGIQIHNTAGVIISHLTISGNGVGKNNGNGIECRVDKPGLWPSSIVIEHCAVLGFGKYGILLQAAETDQCGFMDVVIEHCEATQNGEAGIGSLAWFPAISHRNIKVRYCKAYQNKGILSKTEGHTGNGIVLGGVDGVLIEHCEAYGNGEDNRSTLGGPVGIWLWCCRKGVIQHCSSHHNHAGLHADGGGFNLDGGCEDCVIRRCDSWENEGAGYLICEFGSMQPFRNNKIVRNTSRNDGLKNGYGAITVFGPTIDFCVTKTLVARNKISVSNESVVNGTPAAIYLYSQFFRQIEFRKNQFTVEKGANLLRCDTVWQPDWSSFHGNKYDFKGKEIPVSYSGVQPIRNAVWQGLLGIESSVCKSLL